MDSPDRVDFVAADGQTWTLGKLELADVFEVARDCLPERRDPLAIVAAVYDKFPREIADRMAMQAYEDAKHIKPPSAEDISAVLTTPEALVRLAAAMLRRHHPEVTLDDTVRIFASMSPEDQKRMVPLINQMVPGDDAAAPAAGNTTPTPAAGVAA